MWKTGDSWSRGSRCFWTLIAYPCAPPGGQHGPLGTPAGDELGSRRRCGSEGAQSARPRYAQNGEKEKRAEDQLGSPINHFVNCTLETREEMKEALAGVGGKRKERTALSRA